MGAHADALNKQNETPLHIVTRQNRNEILRILLNYAKNLDVCSELFKRPFKSVMDEIHIDKLKMAIMLVRAGCDVNLGYNRDILNFGHNSTAQLITVNSNESPLRSLFRITKINFRFISNLLNSSTENFEINNGILPFHDDSPFRTYINLIEIIFCAGYRSNQNDSILYKESWLLGYLSGFASNTHEYHFKQILDSYFINSLNMCFSLQNLCKFKIRSLLNKPLNKSINALDIPVILKKFLDLEF